MIDPLPAANPALPPPRVPVDWKRNEHMPEEVFCDEFHLVDLRLFDNCRKVRVGRGGAAGGACMETRGAASPPHITPGQVQLGHMLTGSSLHLLPHPPPAGG